MAISSPSPRFHFSLHLQNPNPNPAPSRKPRPTPTIETLRRCLLRRGVSPTPKILHALRKKEALKSLRRARKETAAAAANANANANAPPKEDALVADDEARFSAAVAEYRALMGRPWDGARGASGPPRGALGEGRLEGLREMLAARRGDKFRWLLEDDVEVEEVEGKQRRLGGAGWDSEVGDEERRIEWLVRRFASFPALAVSGFLGLSPALEEYGCF